MVSDGTRQATEDARDAARDVRGKVTERIADLRGYAGAADAAIRGFARERPLAAIACAVGVGFIVGRLASRA